MNKFSIRNEWADNNAGETSNIKRTPTTKQQEIPGKAEENKSTDTKKPNPANAPLNYIDNMWEREKAQKKYEKEIEKKQQELVAILSAYENKWDEIDKLRNAKIELEVELQKIMWIIIKEMNEDDEMLAQIYRKIGLIWDETEDADWEGENTEWENNEDKESEEQETEWTVTIQLTWEQIKELLSQAWINFIPVYSTENWEELGNWETWEDWEEDWEEEPDKSWNTIEFIDQFLFIKDAKNRDNFKKDLDTDEIKFVEELYKKIKENVDKYRILRYQIKNMENRISYSENKYNTIGKIYNQKREEVEKMEEDMQKENEKYFLDSYQSTKKVPLDSFVSSPLVEKQISNIIELNKKWKSIPKTILLYWKPNLWKTYAANVLATELWRKMYHIKSYDIFTWWFSDPNAMIDAIFTWAIKKKEPCIIFLDEIENFCEWYNWSPYQNLLENTIRHHISKIKDSSLDIIIIWAIADKNKVSPNILKQDVFSKQIYFETLWTKQYEKLFHKMIAQQGIKLWNDIDINSLLAIKVNNGELNQEYIKKLISIATEYNQLNNSWESENITLSHKDIINAINTMSVYNHNFSHNTWFNN